MKRKIIAGILLLMLFVAGATEAGTKKMLDHSDLDKWEKVTNYCLSEDGKWAIYAVNPGEGDGMLSVRNTLSDKVINIERGYSPKFSTDGKWTFALVKPYHKDSRQAKIDKKEKYESPRDSLVIVSLTSGQKAGLGNVESYKIPEESSRYVAWLSNDTALVKTNVLKDKKGGLPLIVCDLESRDTLRINRVRDYEFSKDGTKLAFTLAGNEKDTLATAGIGILLMKDRSFVLIDRDKKHYGKPVFNEEGTQLAYIASDDTVKSGTKRCALYLSDLQSGKYDPREIQVTVAKRMAKNLKRPYSADAEKEALLLKEWEEKMAAQKKDELLITQYSEPVFSHNGRRLIVSVGRFIEPDDTTIVEFEQPSLDIWRWDAPYTPPQELNMKEDLVKKTYPVVIDLGNVEKQVLITDNPLCSVTPPDRWDGDWALVADNSENIASVQWDYQYPVKAMLKNVISGEMREIGYVPNESFFLSPADKYVVWFSDRCYHIFDISDGKTRIIGEDIPYPLWEEESDMPLKEKEPYGIMGWTDGDGMLFVYDRFDVWAVDPKGEKPSTCITAGEGRKRDIRMRYVVTDPEHRSFGKDEEVVYSLFNYADKRNGLAKSKIADREIAPKIEFLEGYTFTQFRKSKKSDVYSWVQGNFHTSPNVYVSPGLNPSKTKKVSDSNPWMPEYSWGKAELFKWYAYDGRPSEGILYLPDDFEPGKEYPMISYFYETYTEDLYKHFDMEPSWSWINFPFYVSRGYVVFVPDIHYTSGLPGEAAYNYVCSGVEEVCRRYPNIDKKRIGIDGQSWGGYQTAYLVTRTDMFACAGSGAPVGNMISAYGGIRWGTGDSRQAQYEMGQSRIGRTLWEAPELYIANSPVFHADRCHTPLLIMHNDNDGAVPWYQGIEMFMALRRLGKPVWMLQYNGEAHNLKERRNRKDITRRLQQFFDHYLKDSPMPEWMKRGIPVERKGQELGY